MIYIALDTMLFLFVAIGFIVWYGEKFHDYLVGILIVIAVIIVSWLMFFIFRKHFITSAILKNVSSLLFKDDDEADDL